MLTYLRQPKNVANAHRKDESNADCPGKHEEKPQGGAPNSRISGVRLDDKAGHFLGSWLKTRSTQRHHVHRLPYPHRRHRVHPVPHPQCSQPAAEAQCVVPGCPLPRLPLQDRARPKGTVSNPGTKVIKSCANHHLLFFFPHFHNTFRVTGVAKIIATFSFCRVILFRNRYYSTKKNYKILICVITEDPIFLLLMFQGA